MERAELKFKPKRVEILHYFSKNGNPIITGYKVYYDGCAIRRSFRSDTIDVEFFKIDLIGGKYRQTRQGVKICGYELIVASNPGADKNANVEIKSVDNECFYTNKDIYRFSAAQFLVLFPREFIREFLYRASKLENAIKNNK